MYYGVSVSERLFAMICSILPTVNSTDEQKATQHPGVHKEIYYMLQYIRKLLQKKSSQIKSAIANHKKNL